MVREVRWPMKTQRQLEKAYRHILSDSYQNAEKVRADIFAATHKLAAKFIHRINTKEITMEVFRAFELHRFRIAYRIIQKSNYYYQNVAYEHGAQ